MLPSDLVQIVTLITGMLTACFTAWIGLEIVRLNRKAVDAAAKVAEVAVKVVETDRKTTDTLSGIVTVTNRTEKYCNSALGRALRVAAAATAAQANWPNATDEVIEAARIAKKELEDHEARQADVERSTKL